MAEETLSTRLVEIESMLDRSRRRFEEGSRLVEEAHKSLAENMTTGYADAAHHEPMRGLDSLGRERHWIIEIHFVDRARGIGAFFEELLTVD